MHAIIFIIGKSPFKQYEPTVLKSRLLFFRRSPLYLFLDFTFVRKTTLPRFFYLGRGVLFICIISCVIVYTSSHFSILLKTKVRWLFQGSLSKERIDITFIDPKRNASSKKASLGNFTVAFEKDKEKCDMCQLSMSKKSKDNWIFKRLIISNDGCSKSGFWAPLCNEKASLDNLHDLRKKI